MSQFYYTDGKERFGPLSTEELKAKNITPQTLVWKEGFADWMPAGNVDELTSLFLAGTTSTPPSAPYAMPLMEKPPKNWLIESILVTLLCCLPFGIVGIIHATKVETLWNTGQRDAAIKAANDAAKWVKIGFFIGIAVYVIYGVMMVMGVVAGISSGGFDQ